MARRAFPEELEDLEQPFVDDPEAEPRAQRRAPRAKAATEEPKRRRRIDLVYWTIPFAALVAVVMAIFAFHRLESYLINETRFRLDGPADFGQDSQNFQVKGVRRVGREAVLKIFEQDFNRSIYLFPIAERRRQLLGLDWVKEAVVQRRWPSQVAVEITERAPMAFAQFDRPGAAPYFRLVDEEGVLLPVPTGERFDLVVLTGLRPTDIEPERAARVRRAAAMLKEIGPLSARISEVDIRDAGNLRASLKLQDVSVSIQLGSQNFQSRLDNFLTHFDKVHQQRPDAYGFDLRIDGKIIAIGDPARTARTLVKSESLDTGGRALVTREPAEEGTRRE